MTYPDDENGDVLRRLEANGDDLSRPRAIDFTVVFPDENSAERFAEQFRSLGFSSSLEFSETRKDSPWDVIVVKHMMPSHREIGDFEVQLQDVADAHGGHNDGWGCFSERSELT